MALKLAPELDASLSWMNVTPLRLAAMRGHPVVLLFWNSSSAHCYNALQSTAQLAARFRGSVFFVAVHVPKFDFERDGSNALEVMHRKGAVLPLANDADWATWQHYEVGAWPTAILIDPEGKIRQTFIGDREIDGMAQVLDVLSDEYFDRSPGIAEPPRLTAPAQHNALSGPGGLAVSANRLYVADTGHHRILECTHDGRVLRRIGNGNRDFVDGLADTSGFNNPRGLLLSQDRLYVADSGNHALRRIDTRTGEVDTLIGNGHFGDPAPGALREALDSPLDRPFGLAILDNAIFISNASGHQVWAMEMGTRKLRCLSGAGTLGTEDGAADVATFAQPTGLAVVGDQLFVADAASSALRSIRIVDGSVRTVFGRGLFEFGLKDGGARQAHMQHPTALASIGANQGLWIADSGNGFLRKFLIRNQALSTVTLPTALKQPSALASWQNQVWIADATTHLVWRYDADSGELHRLPIGE